MTRAIGNCFISMTAVSCACGSGLLSRPVGKWRRKELRRRSPSIERGRAVTLSGRTIVITGAARGVGRAIARACAENGARLILGDVLEEQGRESARELSQAGAVARFVPLDLADPASIERFASDIASREGAIHGLVNNAAIATNVGGAAFEEID